MIDRFRGFLILILLNCFFAFVELSISLGRCELSCSEEGVDHQVHNGELLSRPAPGKAGPVGPKGDPGPPGEDGSPGQDCDCNKHDEALRRLTDIIGKTYTDCQDVKREISTSGVSVIFPFPGETGIHAYCDQVTDDGGWIVIQRRVGGSEDFYRGWNDYVVGFGIKESDFWMGLEAIHKLVNNGTWEMRIDLNDHSRNQAYAYYRPFTIAGASDNYRLSVAGYRGTAGDALAYHNGMQFTTNDRDNDLHSSVNCATSHEGAWWYNGCHRSNLNGVYGASESTADGVTWYPWYNRHISLKRAEMKIRRVE